MTKRNMIKVRGKSRYVERDSRGRFVDVTNIHDSIKADTRKKTRKKVKPGHGHEGDLKRRKR